jgi:hypothetical protein
MSEFLQAATDMQFIRENSEYRFRVRLYVDDVVRFIAEMSSSFRENGLESSYEFNLNGDTRLEHPPLHFDPRFTLEGDVGRSVTNFRYAAHTDRDDEERQYFDGLRFSACGVEDLPPHRIREHAVVLEDIKRTLDNYFPG